MKSRFFLKLFCPLALAAAFATSAQASSNLQYTSSTTSRPGWTVYTFTDGSGSWDIPTGASAMEVLVVGGGGNGTSWGSGGGGGGLYYTGTIAALSGNVSIAVGAGGTSTANGGTSQFGQILAYGGQSFGADGYRPLDDLYLYPAGVHGGNQGAYSTDGGAHKTAGNLGGYTTTGNVENPCFDGSFDSGGGAGTAGSHGNGSVGGDGREIGITGLTGVYYAGGGGCVYGAGGLGGGGSSPEGAGLANTGGGGGGGLGQFNAGGSGVVIVAMQFSAIPEPSSVLALGCLVGSGLMLRNRRRK